MAKPNADKLTQALKSLANIFGKNHGVLRGTLESVLAEAQGMWLLNTKNPSTKPHYHLNSLNNDLAGIKDAMRDIRLNLLAIKETDRTREAYHELEKGFHKVFRLVDGRVAIMMDTAQFADSLRLIHHHRLEGMSRMIVTGPRDAAHLVSHQLLNNDVKLIPPGIAAEAQVMMGKIRAVPIHQKASAAALSSAAKSLKKPLRSTPLIKKLASAFGISTFDVKRIFAPLFA